MFYEGTLQEGISTAVGQQKLVLCFVTDEGEESELWEKEFLADESLERLIQSQALALRLMAGSEEAGYLAQIIPLPKTPTVVMMKHGELKEYIPAGTSKEDFFRRLRSAFNAPQPDSAAASPSSSSSLANGLAAFVPMRRSPSPQAVAADPQPPSLPEAARSEAVSRVLAERAARLEAEEQEKERKAKQEAAKAAARAKAEAESGAATEAARNYREAEKLKKKRKQEDEERKRILSKINGDRVERRLRATAREQRRMDSQSVGDVADALASAPRTKLPSTTRASDIASLQVRLFDGSTIRSRFPTASPLTEVRTWVDENRGGNRLAYTFKQVLTPLPNKNIDETEEGKTLGELGLVPSSTLVLIPVRRYASAYEESLPPRRGFSGLAALFAWILSWLTWLAGFLRLSSERAAAEAGGGGSGAAPGPVRDGSDRVRGLQNPAQGRRDQQQLYNGNSLNFESRPDRDGDDDEK